MLLLVMVGCLVWCDLVEWLVVLLLLVLLVFRCCLFDICMVISLVCVGGCISGGYWFCGVCLAVVVFCCVTLLVGCW